MNIVNTVNSMLSQFFHNSVCWSCGLGHKGGGLTCQACDSMIKRVHEPCQLCGLNHACKTSVCIKCLTNPPKWQLMSAPLSYQQPISHLIQQLKYNQKLEVLKALVDLALPAFQRLVPKPDLLLPVPLHQNRYLERGFNQSLEITVLISKSLDIPYEDHFVERVIDTGRQSELKLKQRQKNMRNAFIVDAKIAQYQHIAIVDDVVTTGSTVRELTKQCLKAGVSRVDVWALARTELE